MIHLLLTSDSYSCDTFLCLAIYKAFASKIARKDNHVKIIFVVIYPAYFNPAVNVDVGNTKAFNDTEFFDSKNKDLITHFKKTLSCYGKAVSNFTLFSHVVHNMVAQVWGDVMINNPDDVSIDCVDGGFADTFPESKESMQSTIHTYLQCLDRNHARFHTPYQETPNIHDFIAGIDSNGFELYMDLNGPIPFINEDQKVSADTLFDHLRIAVIESGVCASGRHGLFDCLSRIGGTTKLLDFNIELVPEETVSTLNAFLAPILVTSQTLQRMFHVFYSKHGSRASRVYSAIIMCDDLWKNHHVNSNVHAVRGNLVMDSSNGCVRISNTVPNDTASCTVESHHVTCDSFHTLLDRIMQQNLTTVAVNEGFGYQNPAYSFQDSVTMMFMAESIGIPFTSENVIHFGNQFDERFTFEHGMISSIQPDTVLTFMGNMCTSSNHFITCINNVLTLKDRFNDSVILMSGSRDWERMLQSNEFIIVNKDIKTLPWTCHHENILHLALDVHDHWASFEFLFDSSDVREAFTNLQPTVDSKSYKWSKANTKRYDSYRNSLSRISLTSAHESFSEEILSIFDRIDPVRVQNFRDDPLELKHNALTTVAMMIMSRAWDFTPNMKQIHVLPNQIDVNGMFLRYMRNSHTFAMFTHGAKQGTISSSSSGWDTNLINIEQLESIKTRAVNSLHTFPANSEHFQGDMREFIETIECSSDFIDTNVYYVIDSQQCEYQYAIPCNNALKRKRKSTEKRGVHDNNDSFGFLVIPGDVRDMEPFVFGLSKLTTQKNCVALFSNNSPVPEGRSVNFTYNLPAYKVHSFIETIGNSDIIQQHLTHTTIPNSANNDVHHVYHLLSQNTADQLLLYENGNGEKKYSRNVSNWLNKIFPLDVVSQGLPKQRKNRNRGKPN